MQSFIEVVILGVGMISLAALAAAAKKSNDRKKVLIKVPIKK